MREPGATKLVMHYMSEETFVESQRPVKSCESLCKVVSFKTLKTRKI